LGNPAKAVKTGPQKIKNDFGEKIKITAVCTTGSGRYMMTLYSPALNLRIIK
jgi:hypothetical protein